MAPVRKQSSNLDVEDLATRLASELSTKYRIGEAVTNVDGSYPSSLVTGTFGGDRDLYESFGYKRRLTYNDYEFRFKRGGIARRLISDIPLYGLGQGVSVFEDPDPKIETKFEAATNELVTRTHLWERVYRASVQCRIGQYSVLYIGAIDKQPLDKPLERVRSSKDIAYFTPIPEVRAKILSTVTNRRDPRFGLPEFYTIWFGKKTGVGETVHWSRVHHFVENPLDYDHLGAPLLESSWNLFDDLMKLLGGGAEAAYQRADPGMQFELDPDIKLRPQENEDMSNQVKLFKHGKSKVLKTRGVTAKQFVTSPADFSGNVECVMQQIAGTHHVPMRWLLGAEVGELASSQDQENFFHFIKTWQGTVALSRVSGLFDRLIQLNALPFIPEVSILFPDVADLSEITRAQLLDTLTRANVAQTKAGQPAIFTTSQLLDKVYNIQPEDDETESETDDSDDIDEPRQSLTFAAEANSPDVVVVYEVADARLSGFQASINQFFLAQQDAIETIEDSLIASLESGLLDSATILIQNALDSISDTETQDLVDDYSGVIGAVGKTLLKHVKRRGTWLSDLPDEPTTINAIRTATYHNNVYAALNVKTSFDVNNERAIAWARTNAAELVTNVNSSTVKALQELTTLGLEEGIAPRALYRQIREVINLRPDQVQAVANLRQRLLKAKPGDVVKAGKLKFKIPRSGGSASIDKFCARYTEKLRDDRAKLIARTEVNKSANHGQVELWNQAQEAGDLPDDLVRIWFAIVDKRSREEHAAIHGEQTPINEPFSIGVEPGQEPNCRCGQGLGVANV
jgi:hypothetical protein